jgi:tRNA threonylcarbamoyladenosine modification (KEOPS) complex Cgi121 subunit
VADLGGWSLLVAGIRKAPKDPGGLVDRLRAENAGVFVQAADAQAVYGIDHVIGVLQISLEAHERKVMIADRPETEVLLRLARTGQISQALKKAGLKGGRAGCFIAFSKDAGVLRRFGDWLARLDLDDSVVSASKEKSARMAEEMGVEPTRLLDHLLERAAILVRG